jgi:peptide/nickel transport system substrate-binding protein
MNKRDKDGWRLRPDGKPFTMVVEFATDRETACLELIKEYCQDVGVKTVIKLDDGGLLDQRLTSSEIMAWMHMNAWYPQSAERWAYMNLWVWSDDGGTVPLWGQWLSAKNTAVREMIGPDAKMPEDWRRLETPKDKELEGEEPADWWIDQAELEDRWTNTVMGSPEYMALGRQVFDFYVQRMIRIGTIGEIPSILIADKKLGNVPPPGYVSVYPLSPHFMQTYIDQLYWKE